MEELPANRRFLLPRSTPKSTSLERRAVPSARIACGAGNGLNRGVWRVRIGRGGDRQMLGIGFGDAFDDVKAKGRVHGKVGVEVDLVTGDVAFVGIQRGATRTERRLRSLSASASRQCSSVSVAVCGRAGIAVTPASSAWNRSNTASSCESGIPWASQAWRRTSEASPRPSVARATNPQSQVSVLSTIPSHPRLGIDA
jgi:hypothetical protein